MGSNERFNQLKAAAEAARATLVQLEQERTDLNKRLNELVEPISMLRNVVSAWETISGGGGEQTDPAKSSATTSGPVLQVQPCVEVAPERIARGQVISRIEQIMADGRPRSIRDVRVEIKSRFGVDENANSIAMALKRRAARGTYVREGDMYRSAS